VTAGRVNIKDCKIAFFSELARGKDVLDMGVLQHEMEKVDNPNWLHRAVVDASKSCVGLDIDQPGVKALRDKGFEVVCADAQNFDLGRSFDVVAAGDLIEHLDNVGGFLDCVRKHVRPGGVFALSTPNPFWWKTFVHVLLTGRAVVHEQHTEWLCPQTAEQILNRHGFRVSQIEFGSVYSMNTIIQRITWLLDHVIPLPRRLRLNTIMLTAAPVDKTNH